VSIPWVVSLKPTALNFGLIKQTSVQPKKHTLCSEDGKLYLFRPASLACLFLFFTRAQWTKAHGILSVLASNIDRLIQNQLFDRGLNGLICATAP